MKLGSINFQLFVFQFHILFTQLWIWEHAVFTLLRKLNCHLNLSSEQLKVYMEHFEKIKYESLLVRKFWSTLNKICSRPTRFSYLIHQLLTLHSTTQSRFHGQLSSLLVHWSDRERNTHAMLYKCGGIADKCTESQVC